MLVLALRIDESIMVGDNVEIVYLRSHGGQIRLGIKAAKEIRVHRKKIWDRIRAEKESAS